MRVAISADRFLCLRDHTLGIFVAQRPQLPGLALLVSLALPTFAPITGAFGQTLIQVAQESAPGAGDFDCNILGVIRAWETTDTAAAFYNYGGSNDVSCGLNWSYGPLQDTSHLLFADTADGLSLVVIHDAPNVNNGGGSATMRVDVVGSATPVSRTVEDDPSDTYSGDPGSSVFTADNVWLNRNTDGYVLSGFSGQWAAYVEFTETLEGLLGWEAWSQDSGWIPLQLEAGRRVRLAAIPPAPLSTLLALYTFNDRTYHDISGSNHHAYWPTQSSTPPVFVGGHDQFGVMLDATSWLAVDLSIQPSRQPVLTMGGWARPSAATGVHALISHNDGNAQRHVGIDDRGQEDGWDCNAGQGGGPTGNGRVEGLPATANEWQFVAAVYDDSAETVRLHVDGAEITGPGDPGDGTRRRTLIGNNPDNTNHTFLGVVDDVFIIAEALSTERLNEIRTGDYHKVPTCATVFRHPRCATTCSNVGIGFSVDAGGSGTLTYQWQLEAQPGVWVTLGNDPTPLPGGGSAFAIPPAAESTSIGVIGRTGSFGVRCVVENACGSVNSFPATLTVRSAPPGDLNCDGLVNNFDISPFVLALSDPAAYATEFPACDYLNADINCDTRVNNFDIDPFVELLSGG
ncbi:MAG: hypothetical protein JNG88_03355 [Phycisphaerales bacterium]|nr:hypothetical protein [Phycisphaerales bacterium]